jgi:hypothetical protein
MMLLLRLGPQAIKRRRLRPKEEVDTSSAGGGPPGRTAPQIGGYGMQLCLCRSIFDGAIVLERRPCCMLAVDAVAAAAEVAAALESEALASALRTADFERQLRLAAEAVAAEARQVSAF